MIRRYPPRPARRPHQDFHFFAGTQRPNNFEPRSFPPPAPPPPIVAPQAAPVPPVAPAASAVPAPQPAPTPVSAPPQSFTHEIIIPISPEKAAKLGIFPDESDDPVEPEIPDSEEPESEDEPSTAALERAMKYLARTEGPSTSGFPEAPAIEQLEPIRPASAEIARQAGAAPKPTQTRPRGVTDSPRAGHRPKRGRPSRFAVPRRSGVRRKPPSDSLRAQHESQCTICSHPYRAAIENEFMHWHAIGHIAYDYKVSRSAIYRHAYAERLFARRNHELRFALGHLIERVQDVDPTADVIVRAIHLFARINDRGECIEPPAHVIVSSGGFRREAATGTSRRPIAISLDSPALAALPSRGAAIDVPPSLPEATKPGSKGRRPHLSDPGAPKGPGTSRKSRPRNRAAKGGTLNRPYDNAIR